MLTKGHSRNISAVHFEIAPFDDLFIALFVCWGCKGDIICVACGTPRRVKDEADVHQAFVSFCWDNIFERDLVFVVAGY